MKVLAIAFFVIAISGINVKPSAAAEEDDLGVIVKEVIDLILNILPETLGVTDINIVIPENPLIKGTVTIGEISLSGIKTPNLETVTYDIGKSHLEYELNFEDVHVIVDLKLDLEGLFNINHHLSVILDLSNLDGKGYADVTHEPKGVTDFSILIGLDKINADVNGLFDDDELSKKVSDELTENGAKVVDDFLADIAPEASLLIKDLINLILKIVSEISE